MYMCMYILVYITWKIYWAKLSQFSRVPQKFPMNIYLHKIGLEIRIV